MKSLPTTGIYKGDKWAKALGSSIPLGATVRIIRYCAKRRVLVEYEGITFLTMLWCLDRR